MSPVFPSSPYCIVGMPSQQQMFNDSQPPPPPPAGPMPSRQQSVGMMTSGQRHGSMVNGIFRFT